MEHTKSNRKRSIRACVLEITLGSLCLFALEPSTRSIAEGLREQPSGTERSASASELSQQGQHFESLVKLAEQGTQHSLADALMGAQSAWGLGLVEKARELWDEALSHKEFQDIERSRAMLGRAILELQEGQFETARAYAEQAAQSLPASDLRAQLWLVIAEALKEQGASSLAEAYYARARDEGSKRTRQEAMFLLGECQLALGRMNDARYTFVGIEMSSPYTSRALRRLAELDLVQRNYEGLLTWIDEGRDSFPLEFGDGWTSYARIIGLIEQNDLQSARKELESYKVRHSDQSPWFPLALAAIEGKEATVLHEELRQAQATNLAEAQVPRRRGGSKQ